MNKKYIIRLTDEERAICEATVKGCGKRFGRGAEGEYLSLKRQRGRRAAASVVFPSLACASGSDIRPLPPSRNVCHCARRSLGKGEEM